MQENIFINDTFLLTMHPTCSYNYQQHIQYVINYSSSRVHFQILKYKINLVTQ